MLIVRPRTIFYQSSRAGLVVEVDQPTEANTGVYPGIPRQDVFGNVTLSTPGQVYENKTIHGTLSVTSTNILARNLKIMGAFSAPGGSSSLVTVTNAGVANFTLEDSEIAPQFPHWFWQSGITGHDFTARRCRIFRAVDGVNVFNSAGGTYYDSNVVLEQNLIYRLGWWTAATSNVVHTSDTETHNDCIQHQGGSRTIIRGNTLDPGFERQYGHHFATNPGSSTLFTPIPLNSLPDGGPYQNLPTRGVTGGAALTTSTMDKGAHDWDDCAALMLNHNQGRTTDLRVYRNWIYGGNYAVNGGLTYTAGDVTLGDFQRNLFDHRRGDYGSGSPGGESCNTITLSPTWAGHVTDNAGTGNANVYMVSGNEIIVRGS